MWEQKKEHCILEYSYDSKGTFLYKWERQKLSARKFLLAFLDGKILAWKNPESLAWTSGKIKSKEGKQRNKRRKISNRLRNSTPKQQLSLSDWKDKRHAQRILKNLMIPQRSTSLMLYSFLSLSMEKGGEKAVNIFLFNLKITDIGKA